MMATTKPAGPSCCRILEIIFKLLSALARLAAPQRRYVALSPISLTPPAGPIRRPPMWVPCGYDCSLERSLREYPHAEYPTSPAAWQAADRYWRLMKCADIAASRRLGRGVVGVGGGVKGDLNRERGAPRARPRRIRRPEQTARRRVPERRQPRHR